MGHDTLEATRAATETRPDHGAGTITPPATAATPPATGTTPTPKPESPAKRAMDRARPLLFVLAGFVCWFAFVTLARVVFKCAPNFQCTVADLGPPAQLEWPDTVVLLTTLCFAVWAARRLVFPRED